MVRSDLLRGKIAEKGLNIRKVAEVLGITPKTMSDKLKKGVFNTDEAEKLVSLLEIENPGRIFFAEKVAHDVTSTEMTKTWN